MPLSLSLSYFFGLTSCESQLNRQFVTKGKGGFLWGQIVSVEPMLKLYLRVEYLTYQRLKPTDLGCGTRKTTPCWAVLVWSRENNLIENHSLVQNIFSLTGLYLVAGGGHKPTWTKLNASPSLSLRTNLKPEDMLCNNQIRQSPVECKKCLKCAFQIAAMGFFLTRCSQIIKL